MQIERLVVRRTDADGLCSAVRRRRGIGQVNGSPTPVLPAILQRIRVHGLVLSMNRNDHANQQKTTQEAVEHFLRKKLHSRVWGAFSHKSCRKAIFSCS